MEYQKIINLWDHTPNQPIRFRTKNRFEKSDDSHGSYNTNNQIKFKTLVLRSSLCDYSDRYILVSENYNNQCSRKWWYNETIRRNK